jgi:formate dehydrogenase major subunit
VPGLGTTFGRGGATNFQQDIQNADCVWIQGSSMAEAHPVGFRWVMKARERGAKVIHVDPHYSRTSAVADIALQIRPGTDIAFVGGLIRHVIETESHFRDYVVNYTNAGTIINENYKGPEDLEGVFAGYDPETGTYDRNFWMYEGGEMPAAAGQREHATQAFSDRTGAGMHVGKVDSDPTLEDPRCVFQIMKRHYARYTPEMVERVCGIAKDDFLRVAETLIENSGRERTSMLVYAVGWTQHSTGVQMIRAGAILQLLLGNVGRPGGGVMAMRGHASIQGSSDIPTLYELLPGYLPMPRAAEGDLTLESYVESGGSDRGWWCFFDVYIVSLLKAWFGDAATEENDYGFGSLPKISGNHSHFATMLRALDGGLDGLFVMGQNPAVGSQNASLQRRALANLKWLVVRDLAELETARFWKDSPEVQSGELRSEDIQTEVFLMPAAGHVEKEGNFTNTQRLLQWRDKALDPPGDARSELHFMHHLAKRVMAHYADSEHDRDWPLRHLNWDYPEQGEHAEPSAESVLKEIGGYEIATGRPLSGFSELQSDGTTACGCWIYSGCYADGVNQPRRRDPGDVDGPGGWVSPEWGWAWPANRRLLYNRASADPSGTPWSERKKYVWWDEEEGRWTGYDVPDFPVDKRPAYRAPDDAEAMDAISGDDPFIMMADGRGWLFSPSGLLDGPLPTHYEPLESPVENALYPNVEANPVALTWDRDGNRMAPPHDPRYPVVASTFRLTEHHTAGPMSRNLPWLAELQPEMFCELDPALAADRGISDGEWMTIYTERGEIEARAKVTNRIRPLTVGDRVVHQISLPWHWGNYTTNDQGVTGDAANDLVPLTGDPNVSIEDKSFACNVRAGRRSRAASAGVSPPAHPAAHAASPNKDHAAEQPRHSGAQRP